MSQQTSLNTRQTRRSRCILQRHESITVNVTNTLSQEYYKAEKRCIEAIRQLHSRLGNDSTTIGRFYLDLAQGRFGCEFQRMEFYGDTLLSFLVALITVERHRFISRHHLRVSSTIPLSLQFLKSSF